MIKFFQRKLKVALIAMAIMLVIASCFDDDENNAVQPVSVAYVSLYHASPDAPGLDIIVDNNRINVNPFDYTDFSGYQNFYTGDRNIKFNAANAANSLVDTTLNLTEGRAYSIFIIDRLSSIEALIVQDSVGTPVQDKAMLRFVHLSPDASALDITTGDQTLFAGRTFRQASEFVAVDAKPQAFQVKAAGGDQVLLSAEDLNLLPGRFYTIIVRGFANPPAGNNNILSAEVI